MASLLIFLNLRCSAYYRLSEGEPAIISGHLVMNQHGEALGTEPLENETLQNFVLENAARKRYGV